MSARDSVIPLKMPDIRLQAASARPQLSISFPLAGGVHIRVFGIDIEACARCGGKLKVIASIEEPAVVAKILAHLEKAASDRHQTELPLGARAPPVQARLI